MPAPLPISVALATYNGARFLPGQLESLVRQTTTPCELVVVDDASTDETPRLLAAFAERAPFPVRLTQNGERRSGQIAVMSSIAAFVPLPGLPSYCASKAALLAYALALRETVRGDGVGVSAVCPGYVDTVLLRRLSGPRPALITPAAAADAIFAGLQHNRRIIAFPTLIALLTRLIALLPEPGIRLMLPAQTVAPPEEI